MPVIDHTHAAPLSFAPPRLSPTHLSETTRPLDDDAELRPKDEGGLKRRVLSIIEG